MDHFATRLVAVVAVGALLSAAGAHALDKPGVITITAVETRHAYVDTGGKGTSVGDMDVYTMLLYNKRITPRSLGHASMLCTRVSSSTQNCSGTYFLPQGEIVAEGVIGSRLIYALPVTGGTELYSNVRGTLTATSLHRRPNRDLLVFRLVV